MRVLSRSRLGLLVAVAALGLLFRAAAAEERAAAPEATYPMTRVSNGVVDLTFYLPHPEKGFYLGPRFDRSGMISKATYGGHVWFGRWQTGKHDPMANDDVVGPAGEFGMGVCGMPAPLGYDEAEAGQSFLKIGVGELKKQKAGPYRFYGRFDPVRPAPWKVTQGDDWIEFLHQVKDVGGYGYRYLRRVALAAKEPAFSVKYTLENIGKKPIHQTYYSHNFVMIDGQPIGPDYQLSFPFAPKATHDLKGKAAVEGRDFVFTRALEGSLYTVFEGFGPTTEHNAVLIRNKRAGAAIRIDGDTPMTQLHFFATARTICPESFIEIRLAPGEKKTWSDTYTLIVGQEE